MAGTLFFTNPYTGAFSALTGLSKGLLAGGALLGLSALTGGSKSPSATPAQPIVSAAPVPTDTAKRKQVASRRSVLSDAMGEDSELSLTRPQSVLGI